MKKTDITKVLHFTDCAVTTRSINREIPRAYTVTTIHNDFLEMFMNTEIAMNDTKTASTNRERTLQTLFQVICQEDEFSLLRETLRIYCEELNNDLESASI